jgi:peptidylprolyl isomerase
MRLLTAIAAGMLIMSSTAHAADVTTPSGLKYHDEAAGTGPAAKAGDTVNVQYTGWLRKPDGSKGTRFDSSLDRGQPFTFRLGQQMVIAGWDEGVAGMQAGGKRTLIIPPALGYGSRGAGGVIPPNATLIFDVELVSIQ